MDEPIKLDRTWLCSVVFLDIVQYSRQSLEIQTQWKRRFNQYLAESIKGCTESERIILDTGDGAAICFLGDPETAMFCALNLVSAIAQEKNSQATPFLVRAGINLGSVKLVRDINGNLNAVGDGINVGQRVMSFAGDNQILVSRSFFEVASSLSDTYAALFKYEGVHTDKHVREHTLYELHPPGTTRPEPKIETEITRSAITLTAEQLGKVECELAGIAGPIAKHLVKKAAVRAQSPEELLQALLAFIPAKADQEKFRKGCGSIFPEPQTTAASASPTPAPATVSETQARNELALGPDDVERARKELTVYMGPMARLLVDRAAAKAKTRKAFYEALAAEIPSAQDREKFIKQTL